MGGEPQTDITEFVALEAEKVSGVGSPANDTPWLVRKEDGAPLLAVKADTDSDEEIDSDDATAAKACGDAECGVCESVAKGKLKAADRKKLPKGSFAIPEKAPGSGSYPVPDEAHARDALARASGKDVEGRVRAAVRRRFPNIAQAEKAEGELEPVEKSPGVPDFSVAAPEAAGHVHRFAESGVRGPMVSGTKEPVSVDTPGGETPAVGGSNTAVIPTEANVTTRDAWSSLADAQAALEHARAAVAEKGEEWLAQDNETVEKVGRRLSTKTETALRAARDHLSRVLGEDSTIQAGHDAGATSEEDEIMTQLTKEELDALVAKAASDAVKADRKARKARAAKRAEEAAAKNANNGGDIDPAALNAGVHGTHDADELSSLGGGANSHHPGASKSLEDRVEELTQLVTKMASRPRSGGPNLTGILPAGVVAAAEGRQGEEVVKSAEDANIERLIKERDDALAGKDANRASEAAYRLTHAELVRMHREGDRHTVGR